MRAFNGSSVWEKSLQSINLSDSINPILSCNSIKSISKATTLLIPSPPLFLDILARTHQMPNYAGSLSPKVFKSFKFLTYDLYLRLPGVLAAFRNHTIKL